MSSIAYQSFELERATTLAPRIVVARILEIGAFRFPGSAEHAPQKEGQSLQYYRAEVLRTIKGAATGEVRVFSAMSWFYHTHAGLIRDNVISYAEPHYRGTLAAEEITIGSEVVFFLNEDPAPAGFPPGSVFLSFGEAYDRVDREAAVAHALQHGPYADFNTLVQLKPEGKIRFPDGLEVKLLGHGHKRPMVDGPRCEFTELGLTKGENSGSLRLNHVIEPDGSQTWDSKGWNQYQFDLRGISAEDGTATFVVVSRPLLEGIGQ